MWKIFVYYLIINIINVYKIESCSSLSSKPECPEYVYKNYQERQNIISKLPNKRRVGHLSLVGTHQSMTYLSKNLKIQTQELSVFEQLKYGIRVLDITVRLQDNKLNLYSKGTGLNRSMFHVLYEIEQFLYFHSRELMMLIINYDMDDKSRIVNNRNNPCNAIYNYMNHNVGGWRLVNNWTLEDTIGNHRGKILLATYNTLLSQCIRYIKTACLLSTDVNLYDNNNNALVDNDIDNKWFEYVQLVKHNAFRNEKCYIYDLSIHQYNYKYNQARSAAKYGGLKNPYTNKCIIPINYRFDNEYQGNLISIMNIFIVDYFTTEIVNRVDEINYLGFNDSLYE